MASENVAEYTAKKLRKRSESAIACPKLSPAYWRQRPRTASLARANQDGRGDAR